MKYRLHTRWYSAALLIASIGGYATRLLAQSSAPSQIIIGASMGSATPSAISSVRSMRMAVEEINAAGGIKGIPLVLKVEYGKTTDTASMDSTVRHLIQTGAVMIISGSGSANTLRAAQITIPRGILLMTASSSSPRISSIQDKSLVWRTIPSDTFQANAAAKLLRQKGHTTVGIIAIDNAYGTALAEAFSIAFRKASGKVVASVSYPELASYEKFNMKSRLDTLYAQKPSAVYLITYNDDGAKIVNESRSYFTQNYKPFFLGCDGNYNNDFLLSSDADLIEGMEGLAYVHPMNYANYTTFFTKFKEYGSKSTETSDDLANVSLANLLDVETTNSYAATSYDAVYVFALAALQANNLTPSEIARHIPRVSSPAKDAVVINVGEFAKAIQAIKNGKPINYEGASGPLEFDAQGDVRHGNYIIWRITKGKFTEAGTISFP
ncbi:MAG: ABC transporter substrate-binding protein [Bacteroidota bacterium]|nr:ABC transporter substrate-binding protein [Candidatus Kapabacteria bacterium]MDW8220771.1 ABC transporter substrate-binding protein [Bacteroidota bacterium]